MAFVSSLSSPMAPAAETPSHHQHHHHHQQQHHHHGDGHGHQPHHHHRKAPPKQKNHASNSLLQVIINYELRMIKHRSHCIYLALGQPMVGSDCLEPRFLARSLGKTFSSSPLAKQPDKTKVQGMGILPFKEATSYITTASPSCSMHHWITRDSHKGAKESLSSKVV